MAFTGAEDGSEFELHGTDFRLRTVRGPEAAASGIPTRCRRDFKNHELGGEGDTVQVVARWQPQEGLEQAFDAAVPQERPQAVHNSLN